MMVGVDWNGIGELKAQWTQISNQRRIIFGRQDDKSPSPVGLSFNFYFKKSIVLETTTLI